MYIEMLEYKVPLYDLQLDDIFEKQYFAHISPEGLGPSDLAEKSGYEYIMIAENLALGNFKDDNTLVNAWMDSPGHRANILNNRYTEIGVAVGKGFFSESNENNKEEIATEVWIAVQEFGLPLSSCPKPEESLLNTIERF